MQIQVGYTTDEPNKVNKTYHNKHTYRNCVIKENTSIIRPTFILTTMDDFASVNYCYVASMNRYYYINNIVCLPGNRVALECKCDVLMSFKADILKTKAIIDKQQSSALSSNYIDDNSYVTECRTVVQATEFPNGFSKTANIIITAGG